MYKIYYSALQFSKMATPVIGIDLGTSYSTCAVVVDGQVEIIKDEFGQEKIPSFVAFTDKGRLVGTPAKQQLPDNASNTVFGIKRFMGVKGQLGTKVAPDMKLPFAVSYPTNKCCLWKNSDKNSISITCLDGKLTLAPEQVSAVILSKLKRLAEKKLSHKVEAAVISVPASFNSYQRQATVDAGKIAGFEKVHLINEPTAIAMTYCEKLCSNDQPSSVLILDVGGGFMSLTEVSVCKSEVEIKNSVTLPFGGLDLDVKMMQRSTEKIGQDLPMSREKRRLSCENAREELINIDQTAISVLLTNEET